MKNEIKKICLVLFTITILFCTSVNAQKNGSVKINISNSSADQNKQTYSLAMKYGDYASATQSVYAMMISDTGSLALKDTLANLFFARGMYNQCLVIGKEIYAKQPDNDRVLELLAVSEQSLGNNKESLDYYEKLYPRSKQLYHIYQMVILQYGLKRIGECNQNIETIINDPNSEKEQITMNIGQGYQQRVPYKAAALNIRGVIAKELGDSETAKKCFEDALKVFPDFVLAKNNLDDMNKPLTDEKTKTSPEKK